ncbi:MAG: MBL fold metallo-hydrolase [Paludibacteraceae bacterium]|nr:MBL fold metallo-hydrolase [Paludibacteraceae bacterium]
MNIKTFYFNPYRECTYVVDNGQGQCFIVDPGMYSPTEEQRITDYIKLRELQLIAVVITHSHPDHICGLDFLRDSYPNITVFGFNYNKRLQVLDLEKEEITGCCDDVFSQNHFSSPLVIHTPGHKEDSVCYYFEKEKILFTGDTLFQESVGRTDLEGGDTNQLLHSLHLLMKLPEDTAVYPGHAYPTTIGHEKEYNPYV